VVERPLEEININFRILPWSKIKQVKISSSVHPSTQGPGVYLHTVATSRKRSNHSSMSAHTKRAARRLEGIPFLDWTCEKLWQFVPLWKHCSYSGWLLTRGSFVRPRVVGRFQILSVLTQLVRQYCSRCQSRRTV
jgi:hypothetical protein